MFMETTVFDLSEIVVVSVGRGKPGLIVAMAPNEGELRQGAERPG